MTYFVIALVLVAFVGGCVVWNNRRKLKAKAQAELKAAANAVKSKL